MSVVLDAKIRIAERKEENQVTLSRKKRVLGVQKTDEDVCSREKNMEIERKLVTHIQTEVLLRKIYMGHALHTLTKGTAKGTRVISSSLVATAVCIGIAFNLDQISNCNFCSAPPKS